jgi:hypothetical protein
MEGKRRRNQRLYEDVSALIDDDYSLKDACIFLAHDSEKTPDAIRKIYYRSGGNKKSSHGNCILDFCHEALLLGLILAFSAMNNPMTAQEVKANMETVCGFVYSDSSLYSWIEKHEKEIRKQKSKKLAKKDAT